MVFKFIYFLKEIFISDLPALCEAVFSSFFSPMIDAAFGMTTMFSLEPLQWQLIIDLDVDAAYTILPAGVLAGELVLKDLFLLD